VSGSVVFARGGGGFPGRDLGLLPVAAGLVLGGEPVAGLGQPLAPLGA
jgi:hypothetical protein